MKTTLKLIAILFISIILFGSCKKNSEEIAENKITKLVKIANWNPVTGAETVHLEPIYDSNGKLINIIYNGAKFGVVLNSNGKISQIIGVVGFTLTYNSIGLISKIVYTNTISSLGGETRFYEYDVNGKLIKFISSKDDPKFDTNYNTITWKDGNLFSSVYTPIVYNLTDPTFDNKLNPYNLIPDIYTVFYTYPMPGGSKNNLVENKLTERISTVITTVTQKRVYEYNTQGYPTSMRLEGSTEGKKFYYDN